MLDKNAQIIKFIVERLSGKLGRVHLLKLIYLVDYYSRRLFGSPVSTFHYVWWEKGPFDKRFYDHLKDLSPKYIQEEEIYFPSCRGYLYHDVPTRIQFDFTERERYILLYAINTFGEARLGELLEGVVYETEPMVELIKKKAFGGKLNMDQVNNLDRNLYRGINPEDIIEGKKAVAEGKVRSLEEVFSDLHSKSC